MELGRAARFAWNVAVVVVLGVVYVVTLTALTLVRLLVRAVRERRTASDRERTPGRRPSER